MTAPSNANTSGLEVVAWTNEEYLADTRARKHGAYWMWGNPASEASVGLVTAASAQARIAELISLLNAADAHASAAEARVSEEKVRADRLAKALEPFSEGARMAEISGRPPSEFCDASDYQDARAALQQEPTT